MLQLALLLVLVLLWPLLWWSRRKAMPTIPLKRVDTPGLHEGQWFAAWLQLNAVHVDAYNRIQVAGVVLTYAGVDGLAQRAWMTYVSQHQRNTPLPYARSIRVVVRDWHDAATAQRAEAPA